MLSYKYFQKCVAQIVFIKKKSSTRGLNQLGIESLRRGVGYASERDPKPVLVEYRGPTNEEAKEGRRGGYGNSGNKGVTGI